MNGSHLVREARKRAGLSQAQLAARAGTTQSSIARLESGRTAPSLERVTELVRACGLDLEVHLVPYDDHGWTMVQEARRSPVSDRVQRNVDAANYLREMRRSMAGATRG